MCHHLIEGLSDGLDMFYGTREAWFDEAVAAQPQGFCRVAAMASPRYRKRTGLDAVDALWRIGFARPREVTVGPQEVHDMLMERAHAALFDNARRRSDERREGGVLGELASIVAESGRLKREFGSAYLRRVYSGTTGDER